MNGHVESIFETFKVGAGPSSSHSIGPHRATRHFLASLSHSPARLRVTLLGSLAATGRGHLTDRAILEAAQPVEAEIRWDTTTPTPRHPNTMIFESLDGAGVVTKSWTAYSIGGGSLADDNGPVASLAHVHYPIHGIADAIATSKRENIELWRFVELHETDIWPKLDNVWCVMRESIERGLRSTQTHLPGTLGLVRRAPLTFSRAHQLESPRADLARISAYALAVGEENAAGGWIVTAPSCGPAGVVPGVLYFFEKDRHIPRDVILRALATAGLFGSVIRANASVSGAEVGCQGEIGSACSMAAAAAAQLLGGTLDQIEYAAEMGMEHHLGLTCDPIEGYVQVPCIERTMAAALRAYECASFALLTDGQHLVSFDEVIEVMYRTGVDMGSAYRETARGGLAQLWRQRLARGAPAEPVPTNGRSQCD